MPEFPCPEPISVTARIGAGLLEISAEPRTTAAVEVIPWDNSDRARDTAERVRVDLHGDQLIVDSPDASGLVFRRSPRVRVSIRVPQDSTLLAKVASADLRCAGRYATAQLSSASGDVYLAEVTGDLALATASGDALVDQVGGRASAKSASGDLSIGSVAGDLTAQTASGDLRVDRADGSLTAATASGDVTVGAAHTGVHRITTASGDVRVGVRRGTGVWVDLATLSGDTRSDLAMSGGPATASEQTATMRLSVRTASGDIVLHRVEAAPA